jgi:hypothetical protein
VPGGLLEFVKCNEIKGEGLVEKGLRYLCEKIFENKYTGVNATTELAAPASSIELSELAILAELPFPPYPPGLTLPVKVKLENELLGNECYIGSSKEPILLSLGSASPGKLGEVTSRYEGNILVIKHNTLAGSSWEAPKATGCGPGGLLDSIVDSKLGLPSKPGNNTAILNNTIEQTGARGVEKEIG